MALLVAWKSLFSVLMLIMAGTLVYSFVADGQASCFDPTAWWMIVAETDYFLVIIPIMAWFFYKESSWIKRVAFVVILFFCGSFITCGYIAILFFKLSPEDSAKDPFYFVLARAQNRNGNGLTKPSRVVTAKVIVTAIGCFFLGLTIYAYIIDGFPFHVEVLTPCMITAIIDISIHIVVFSVWITYKESRWTSTVLWILLLLCFSGIGLWVYIIRELFYLSPHQQVSDMIFNKNNRDIASSDPLLMEHSDV